MRILTVVGARPQFIKAAALSRAVDRRSNVVETLIHTGQHFDDNLSKVFFQKMDIRRPAENLGIGGGGHGSQTGRMLIALEEALNVRDPDVVLVYGDTNSTLAGALAAVKLHLPVAHVEAGLRSFNRSMPEEINRVLTDDISDFLFCPTAAAVSNLRDVGIREDRIHFVGDIMYDVALIFQEMARDRSRVLNQLEVSPGNYVLATVHRAANTDNFCALKAVVEALIGVSNSYPVVLPLHPRTKGALEESGLGSAFEGTDVTVTEPVGYLDMMALEQNAAVIVTDSGGVQKEAYFHGVPCVTLRSETEWIELVQSGWNVLVPPGDPTVMTSRILERIGTTGEDVELYGSGDTAEKIIDVLERSLG